MARAIILCCGLLLPSYLFAAPPVPLSQFDLGTPPKPVVRLFWQDRDANSLRWADVVKGDEWTLAPAEIDRFPKLTADRQKLAKMKVLDGTLLVGVQDDENGEFESGWIALSTGVDGHSHGNHIDWHYDDAPEILVSRLDDNQGNPGHLYTYDGAFYLANDNAGGFTQIFPEDLRSRSRNAGRFFPGGSGHITLAAAENRVAYSTWNNNDGPDSGRVDVVNLQRTGRPRIDYSFHLPSGAIRGALAHEGRIFFAPEKGVCWLEADLRVRKSSDDVQVNYVDLGTDAETGKPLRTTALINYRNYVLFSTGTGQSSALCLLDPTTEPAQLTRVPIDVKDGLFLAPPQPKYTADGNRYAFLLQHRQREEGREVLTVVDLDPNWDQDLSDAEVLKTIKLGPVDLNGNEGRHSIAFDDDGEYACITNSGNGTIWLLSLRSVEVLEKFDVGGTPQNLISYGAENPH